MSRTLERKAGVIACFNQITWRNLLTGSELETLLPLRIMLRTDEGSKYSLELQQACDLMSGDVPRNDL